MSSFVFELDFDGVRELLQSQEMADIISEYTDHIVSNAGEGYEGNTEVHNRAVGMVWAETKEARIDNEDNNTLLRALYG